MVKKNYILIIYNKTEGSQKDCHLQNLTNFSVPSPPLLVNPLGCPKTFCRDSLTTLENLISRTANFTFFLITPENCNAFLINRCKFHMLILQYEWKLHVLNPLLGFFKE